MTEHVLVGGDPHLLRLAPGRNICNCFGTCCLDIKTMICHCKECQCTKPWPKAAPIVELRIPVDRPEHACVVCGVEVFRNGTRGRFPSKCPTCKEK